MSEPTYMEKLCRLAVVCASEHVPQDEVYGEWTP